MARGLFLAATLVSVLAGCDGDDGFTPGGEEEFELTVEDNPHSVLSCIVSWTTDDATSPWVEFEGGGATHVISDDGEGTDHRVTVVGDQYALCIQAEASLAGVLDAVRCLDAEIAVTVDGHIQGIAGRLDRPLAEIDQGFKRRRIR